MPAIDGPCAPRRRCRGWAMMVLAVLACLSAAAPATAATSVTGATDANVPLEITPDTDAQVSTDDANVYVGTVVYFIQKLPASRTVTSITMGDFRSSDACDGQNLPLTVLESDTGEYGSWSSVASADAHLGVHMGRVTWTIPATVFHAGKGYAFELYSGDYAPCSVIESRTWAHNAEVVNAGPGACTIYHNWTPYEPQRRYWHVHGQDDIDDTCTLGFDLKPANFDASMPTGWLSVYKPTYSGPLVRTNTSSSQPCPSDHPSSFGQATDWPEQPATAVCTYPQFTPPGEEVPHGWYYGIAHAYWNGGNDYYAAVRDRYLRLADSPYTGGGETGPGGGTPQPQVPSAPSPTDLAGDGNPGAPNLADGKCVCGDPIDAATGSLVENATDLGVGGRGVPLVFGRTYNSMLAGDPSDSGGHVGAGWSAAWSMHLSLPTLSDPSAVVHNDNGSTVPFLRRSDGSFDAPTFVSATLTALDSGYRYALRDGTAYAFDADGRLTAVTDHNGYVTSLTYNAAGRLIGVSNEAGRSLSLSYDAAGRLQRASDPIDRAVTYAYDAEGNLASVTDVGGGVTRYGYDAAHHLTSVTDQNDHSVTTSYDAQGRAVSQTDAENQTTRFGYATDETVVTDPRAIKQRLQFAHGLLTSETDALGSAVERTITYRYDAAFNQIERTDARGSTMRWTYDGRGDRLTSTDELGRTTTMTYTDSGRARTVTDPAGETTTYAYDAHDNVTDISAPLDGSTVAKTHFTYDPDHPGDTTSQHDPTDRVRTFTRDSAGYLLSVTDGERHTTSFTYNQIGWRTSSTSPQGNTTGATAADYTTTFTRDAFGRPTRVRDHLGRTTAIGYDAAGNRTTVTDSAGHTTTVLYDNVNRPIRTVRADATHTDQRYDADGNMTATADGLGHLTQHQYDALNRVTSTTDPIGHETRSTYDAADRRRSLIDANGETTSYAYDDAAQVTNVAFSNTAMHDLSYGYDADGRRTDTTDATGHSSFAYDALGRLTSTTTPGPISRIAPSLQTAGIENGSERIDYGYDLAGRVTQIAYPAELPTGSSVSTTPISATNRPTSKRRYDEAGRLIEVDDFQNRRFLFAYDADGHLTSATKPNATRTMSAYDRGGQPTRITTTGPNGTLLDLPYSTNTAGLISASNATSALSQLGETYSYDALDQIVDAKLPSGQGSDITREQFAYDAADRTTSIATVATKATLSYDDADQLTKATDPTTNTQLATFAYDADGQRTTQTDITGAQVNYSYDQTGQLTRYRDKISSAIATVGAHVASSITSSTPADSTYRYNAGGLRADLLWDHTSPDPIVLEDPTHLYITGPGGLPLEQVDLAGTALYYDHDAIGSTRLLTQQDGHPVAYSDYDTYGRPIKPVDAALNPFGFAGQYTDASSGLIYMRARWYDPRTTQFLTRDPLGLAGGDHNPYGYANRDPVNLTDPSGLCATGDHGYRAALQALALQGAMELGQAIAMAAGSGSSVGASEALETFEIEQGALLEEETALIAAGEGRSLAGRDTLGRFTGAGGYGAEAEARGLSEYELATGQTVIRSQVRASLSEGGAGRFYDGLVQNADGTYTGIEVKSGSAALSASQRAFDAAINGGRAARATLNGQPIDITSTELVRVR